MPDVAAPFPNLTVLTARDDIVIPQGGNVKPTMGSIRERARRDGTIGYTAQIILKRKGRDTYREAATFDKRTQAIAWLKNREAELKEEGGIDRARVRSKTLSDAIDLYVTDSKRDLGRTKASVLRLIKGYDIAALEAAEIRSQDIVTFARELSSTGMKPQTVQNYLSHLQAVFAVARTGWGIPLDRQAMQDAFAVAKRLGLTSKSDKRDRRPTVAEIDKLMTFFTARSERSPEAAPMARIIPFALFSTRRLGEILRIEWRDWDAPGSRVLVRDMKHPGEKAGNDQWVDVPPEAVAFMGDPGTGRIFPHTEDAVGIAFTRACKLLEIEDLHFHDLRHEGVSRLFEMGWTIPRVATVSGHRSWQSLQRYTHLRQTGDKWKDWKWHAKGQ
jgi:integrase